MTTNDLHQPEHIDVTAAKVYTANQLHFMHVLDHYVHMKFQSSIVVLTDIKIIFKPRACSQKWIGLVKCTYYYQLKLNSGENKK